MSLFTESPITLVMLGGLAIFASGAFAFMLKKREFVFVAVVCFIATIALVAIERVIVSDKEQINATLQDLADKVENNDVDGILAYTSKLSGLSRRISSEMPNYEFDYCFITSGNEPKVNSRGEPKTAIVEFMVKAKLRFRGESVAVPRRVKLQFEQAPDGKWLIVQYAHKNPLGNSDSYGGQYDSF